MLILLHAIRFQYMLPNSVYHEQGSENKENRKQPPCISHYHGNARVCENPLAWENSCSTSISHGAFRLEEESKVTVKTTTAICGSSEVLNLMKR